MNPYLSVGQNDQQTKHLSGQMVILPGHCQLNGHYFEPCIQWQTSLNKL